MALAPDTLKRCPSIDAEQIDRGERPLQHNEVRLAVDPSDRRPEQRRREEQAETVADDAEVECDQDSAGDAGARADPFGGV